MIGADHGVLAAQQTSANLHVSIGDTVAIQRAGGLPPVEVRIDGVISLPDAQSLFQKVGVPSGTGPQAPPDNVVVLPVEIWRRLFLGQMAIQPESVQSQVHVRTARHNLPDAPEAAYEWVLRQTNHLGVTIAGRGVITDNLASRLASVRGDALYARVLFLFLGLPSLVVAALLTLGIAGSGGVRRRQQQALLRIRGASVALILRLASAEAVTVGFGGCVIGAALAIAVSRIFKIALGVSLTGIGGWLLGASCAGMLLALIAMLQPAWREARHSTVAATRGFLSAKSKPL
jgi:putative ABC transport system permease protein